MDTEKDLPKSEDPNWAYSLLRIVLVGSSIEIMCMVIMVVFSRNGLVPKPLQTVVDYFVVGAVVTEFWAIGSFLLYLCIRPGLNGDSNS